ncbi:hypothetical protein B4U79_16105 [Dinothrombium tinctorium]|uniref:KIF-binding protein n=1 Tax=Dinothrombium tinctorium TaxID=1965070 RepID=A0A3S3S1H2_9ACAR|nr:hypothetical protein B4U79_16105 [Dinothrombium tinctorium]
MGSIKEWLPKAKEDYEKARHLMDIESAKDPISEPFKSRYKAASILNQLKEDLDSFHDSYSEENPLNCAQLISLLIKIDLGINSMETEEYGIGEKYLTSALTLIDNLYADNQSLVLFKCIILNQLAYLWCSRGEYETAVQLLTQAESAYFSWSVFEDRNEQTIGLMDAFDLNPLESCRNGNAVDAVEKTHTQTLYFLAQAYEKLDKGDKSAEYCKRTLKRQYESKDFDAIDWSLHTATLSQYFAAKNDFLTAKHLIACARFVLKHHISNFGDEDERLKRAKADVARICVKYCLMLLEASQNKTIASESESGLETEPFLLNDNEVYTMQNTMKSSSVENFDQARTVFLQAQSWLNEAKDYYVLDEHASDNVECVQDSSKLYRLLSHFETDSDRKYKMLKRRANLLENLLKEINADYFLNQSRQMTFELGEIYSEMTDIKIVETNDKSDAELVMLVKKVNGLIFKAIKYFNSFIDSFRDKTVKELPSTFENEIVRPMMVAYFSIGRLYSKLYTSEPKDQIKNWNACEQYYKKVVAYIERNPSQKELVREELTLVEEMLQLIPGKLALLLNSTTE